MFERFTDRARRVVVLAQEEARMLNHNYIGTEHLLLGLIREEDGVAAQVLRAMGIDLDQTRRAVEEIVGQGGLATHGHIPFTPRGKKVLELSLREALQLGHNYIGTEHILLGLVREGEGVAAQVLQKQGADLPRVRHAVIEMLSGRVAGTERMGSAEEAAELMSEVVPGAPPSPEDFPACASCHAPLAETLIAKTLDVAVGDEPATVKVAYCGRCGHALGTIP